MEFGFKKENFFYVIIFLTVLVLRLAIFLVPEVDLKLSGLIVHHFWIGLFLVVVSVLIPKKREYLYLLSFGIGIGLILDELVFMILGAGKDKEYWSMPSLIGTILLVIIIFPFRKKMIEFINKLKV